MDWTSYKKDSLGSQSMTPLEIKKCLFASPQINTIQKMSPLKLNTPELREIHQESPFGLFKIKKKIRSSNKHSDCLNRDSSHTFNSPISKHISFISLDVNQDLRKRKNLFPPCNSINVAIQKSIQNPDLIGDFTKQYCLPVINGSHADLKCVTSQTVVIILKEKKMNCLLIDCRYPYEYLGGHIQGALNIYTQDDVLKKLFYDRSAKENNTILIFYCEFSSKRAPDMLRFVRNKDRDLNKDSYPTLFYPEMYLLEGGYRAFFEEFKEYCDPPMYKEMLDENYSEDLAFYKQKCKVKKTIRRFPAKRLGLKF